MSFFPEEDDKHLKLPQWAQRDIKVLKDKIAHLENEITTLGAGEGNTIADPWGKPPLHLGDDVTVRFVLEAGAGGGVHRGGYIDVEIQGGKLRVMANERLTIEPHSSNIAYVKVWS